MREVPTLDVLVVGGGVRSGQIVVVNGAGTTVGSAAVQIALGMGARVIATAASTCADRLRAVGALVTAYGEGMLERVRELAGGMPDLVLDTAPVSGVLLDLVQITDGDARGVLTISDFESTAALGVRTSSAMVPCSATTSSANTPSGPWRGRSRSRSPAPNGSTTGVRRWTSAVAVAPAASSCSLRRDADWPHGPPSRDDRRTGLERDDLSLDTVARRSGLGATTNLRTLVGRRTALNPAHTNNASEQRTPSGRRDRVDQARSRIPL